MRKYIALLCLVTILFACKKDESRVFVRKQVTGTLVLTDPFSENLTVPAPGATIYVAQNETANPFSFSVTADDKGKFIASGLPDDVSTYKLVGKYKAASGVLFIGNSPLSSFNETTQTELSLTPQYPGGVLKVVVKDANSSNQPVAGAEVFLFTPKSQTATVSDSEPKPAVPKGITNAKGVAFFYSLLPATYYVVAKTTVNGKIQLSSVSDAVISSTAVVNASTVIVPLELNYPAPKGSITVTVKDSLGDPVTGFKTYAFTNLQQAESTVDANGPNLTGVVGSADTDLHGVAIISNLDPGTYYISARGMYNRTRTLKKVEPVPVVITGRDAKTKDVQIN